MSIFLGRRIHVLLHHKRYLEHYGMIEFPQIQSRKLLYFLKPVDQCVSVDKKLARRLADIEVVFKKLLYGEQRLLVESLYGPLVEDFVEEHLAKSGGKLINQPCNAQMLVGYHRFVAVKYLAHLKGDFRLLKGPRKIPYAGHHRAYAHRRVGVELGSQSVYYRCSQILYISSRYARSDFFHKSNIGIADVYYEVLLLVRKESVISPSAIFGDYCIRNYCLQNQKMEYLYYFLVRTKACG